MTGRLAAYRAIVADVFSEARDRHVLRIMAVLIFLALWLFIQSKGMDFYEGESEGCGCANRVLSVSDDPEDDAFFVNESLRIWYFSIFMATLIIGVLLSAPWVPQTYTRGQLDRFLARPIGRTEFLLVRQAGYLSIIALGNAVLMTGLFLIAGLKSGTFFWGFLAAGTILPLIGFTAIFSYMTLVGVLFESTPLCGVAGLLVPVISMWSKSAKAQLMQGGPEGNRVTEAIVDILYFISPRLEQLRGLGRPWIMGKEVPFAETILINLAVAACTFALAAIVFYKKDY